MTAIQIHTRLLEVAKGIRIFEHEILDLLLQADVFKIYLKFGYVNLWDYCMHYLELSEVQASYYTRVMRKSIEVPELTTAVKEGKISISQARRIVPVINTENKAQWIEKASKLSQKELEFEVARVNPKSIRETRKPISENTLELRLSISRKLDHKLQEVRNQLIEKRGTAVTIEDVLDFLTEEHLEKTSKVRKAERAMKRTETKVRTDNDVKTKTAFSGSESASAKKASSGSYSSKSVHNKVPIGRAPIPAALKHKVVNRSQNQCEHKHQDYRCSNKVWLEMHHVKPVLEGGENSTQNLKLLCSRHHKQQHV